MKQLLRLLSISSLVLCLTGATFINSGGGGATTCTANDTTQCTLPATRADADADFTATNIRSGTDILGVTGTYAPTAPTATFLFDLAYLPVWFPTTPVTHALDQATDQLEECFAARETTAITHLGFSYASRTGTPVQHRISLQGLSGSTSAPDGTIKGGGTPASGLFTPPADGTWNATWQWVTLDNSYAPTRGEALCIVVAPVGTPDGSNLSTFNAALAGSFGLNSFPFAITKDGGGRSWLTTFPLYGYKTATQVIGHPIVGRTLTTYSSDSTPDEYALRFVVPTDHAASYTVPGVRLSWTTPATGKTVKVQLYSDTTVLQTVTYDSDWQSTSGGTGSAYAEIYFAEATLSTLTGGTVYRIGVQPQETSTGVALPTLTATNNADLAAYPGGVGWYLSTRVNAGAWTDDTVKRPLIDPIFKTYVGPAGS